MCWPTWCHGIPARDIPVSMCRCHGRPVRAQDSITAGIPILVVTAKRVTAQDRAKLSGYVTTIMEKADFNRERFAAEVRRAMSGRLAVA